MYLAIIILPFLGAIFSGFFGRKLGVSGAQFITCSSVLTTTLFAILAFFEVGLNNIPVSIQLFRWIDSESLNVSWGFHFDSLTVYFVVISFYLCEIEAVLVLIQLYKFIFIQNLKVVNPFKKRWFFLNSSCVKNPPICPNHRSAGLVYSSDLSFLSERKKRKKGKRGGSTAYKTISSSIKRRNYTSLGSPPSGFLHLYINEERFGGDPSLAPGKAWTSPRPAGASLPFGNTYCPRGNTDSSLLAPRGAGVSPTSCGGQDSSLSLVERERGLEANKDFITYNEITVHSSFSSILSNKTRGGKMLTELILHLHKENVYNIPLFLSPLGIKASIDLINMINLLPDKQKSKFKGDNLLLDFIKNNLKPIIRYNLKSTNNTFIPTEVYNIPIIRQSVKDADCSGVYVFLHISGKLGLGSALSCRDRLQYHLNSFYGNRPGTFLHKWILDNGGITSVKWAPLIIYDNLIQKWSSCNFYSPLSLAPLAGGSPTSWGARLRSLLERESGG